MREGTVSRGVDELDGAVEPSGRVRRPGGGRKKLADLDPELVPALLALVEPDMRGDPMSPLRWTTKSTSTLAAALTARPQVTADTVAGLLHAEGFSLQGNAKTIEGKQSPDRDGQFRYINQQVKAFQAVGDPVVSVDTKKKELIGEYRNAGTEWARAGQPVPVRTHDFPDETLGKAIPYGVYDVSANTGWVNVGIDHDTAAFAVESLRRWWTAIGKDTYPQAGRLLITCDAGGSNGYRTRAWKTELAALAAGTGLEVTVCHFPPGHVEVEQVRMTWRPPRSDEMPSAARRARSPSRYWSADSPQQVWRRTRGTWDCRCEHEPQIRLVTRSSPVGCHRNPVRRRHGTDPRPGCWPGCAP